jgi:hypothetical protein
MKTIPFFCRPSFCRLILTALPLASFATLPAADAPAPASDMKPGTRMILKFPELPQTLYAMQSGQEAVTQAYLALPENYSLERKFPLFVFLYGGHGGPGAGPGRGQQIMENKDCIFVNLPKAVKKLEDAIAANQLNATGLVMKDTGHDMPAKFDADVKAWVLKQLAQ